jgi:cytochrome c biogenesis protein CcmG/thiol:disulfide interchange protein DsbE
MNKTLIKILLVTLALLTPALLIPGCASSSSSAATVGQPAPAFTLSDIDGNSISLTDFAGKPVLINFWNTGCPPCRDEIPYLQQVYDENIGTELVMLTINIGESADTVKDFFQDRNLSLPVLFDTDITVARTYGVLGIPTTFFIDKEGIIRAKVIGAFPGKSAIYSRLSEIMS